MFKVILYSSLMMLIVMITFVDVFSLENDIQKLKEAFEKAETKYEVNLVKKQGDTSTMEFVCGFTSDCDWLVPADTTYTFPIWGDSLCIEFITYLCHWDGGFVSTAYAVYLPNENSPLDYISLIIADGWGWLEPVPDPYCWELILIKDFSPVPQITRTIWLDWAAAFNYGNQIPPILEYCGWPLQNNDPEPFLIFPMR